MIEHAVDLDVRDARLSATVNLPEHRGRFPLVLMIHGTGPLDRDENMTAQPLNVFNTIAKHLALAGIASLRYDKRGCGKSTGDYYRAGHADLVTDAIAWIDALRPRDFCREDRIFVLGHSEGCIIAPQVSAARRYVAGLVLLCPFVSPVEAVLIQQAGQLEGELDAMTGASGALRRLLGRALGMTVASQRRAIDRLTASTDRTMRVRLQRVPAHALRELIRLDPPAIFRRVRGPMLLVGGEKDLQCDPADVGRIAAAIPGRRRGARRKGPDARPSP